MDSYVATVLPGLLQTEDYARAVLKSIIVLPRGSKNVACVSGEPVRIGFMTQMALP